MVLQTILEGLGLGALLALVCTMGICKGGCWDGASLQPRRLPATAVREAGTYNTRENQAQFSTFQNRLRSGYIGYVLVCVYGINGAHGFTRRRVSG